MTIDFRLSGLVFPANCDKCKKKQNKFIVFSCYLCEEERKFCTDCCKNQSIVVMCRCEKSRKRIFVSEFYKDFKDIMFQNINAEIIFRDDCLISCDHCCEDSDEMIAYKCTCEKDKKNYCKDCCLKYDLKVFSCLFCSKECDESFLILEYLKRGVNRYFVK